MFLVGAVNSSSRTPGIISCSRGNSRGMKIWAMPDPMPIVRVSEMAPLRRLAVSDSVRRSPTIRSAS